MKLQSKINLSRSPQTFRRDYTVPKSLVSATSLLPLWRRIHQELLIRSQQWKLPSNVSMVLIHLYLHPEDSEPALMAQATCLPRQTVTFILDAMEREGLAVRHPHPKDRRRKIVQITAKGEALAKKICTDMRTFESSALKTLKKLDMTQLRTFLTRYADALAAQNDLDLPV